MGFQEPKFFLMSLQNPLRSLLVQFTDTPAEPVADCAVVVDAEPFVVFVAVVPLIDRQGVQTTFHALV